jgi:hypothetical protein
MHAETVIALISVCVAVITAVVVPWLTFRLAFRQDQARWLREQQAQLYADLLTEAFAEKEYLQYVTADDQTRERMRAHFTDLRLGPQERARLGARGAIFGSKTVSASFNRLQDEGQAIMLSAEPAEALQLLVRVKVGGELGSSGGCDPLGTRGGPHLPGAFPGQAHPPALLRGARKVLSWRWQAPEGTLATRVRPPPSYTGGSQANRGSSRADPRHVPGAGAAAAGSPTVRSSLSRRCGSPRARRAALPCARPAPGCGPCPAGCRRRSRNHANRGIEASARASHLRPQLVELRRVEVDIAVDRGVNREPVHPLPALAI